MRRFAARLLFQFRIDCNGDCGKFRLCEERIVNFRARNARAALAEAKKKGKRAEFESENSDGNPVHFEFIGVMDLIALGIECGEDEVWYEIRTRLTPDERKDKLIPNEDDLDAIRNDD